MKVTLTYHDGRKEVLYGVSFIKRKFCGAHSNPESTKEENAIGYFKYKLTDEQNFLDIKYFNGKEKRVDIDSLTFFKVEREAV